MDREGEFFSGGFEFKGLWGSEFKGAKDFDANLEVKLS
jgi:hypothetical protein